MTLTNEQENVINKILEKDCHFIKIEAVAGAGKTHLLMELSRALKVSRGLYIAYNKSIADEAASKFTSGVDCRTIHSLAYSFTVRSFSLKVTQTPMKARMIKEKIDILRKSFLVDILAKYFLSRHVNIQSFVEEFYEGKISDEEVDILRNYFIKMKNGEIDCTHDFYLKLFHILMHHNILQVPEYDFLAMDESGDITGVSLEIFRLLKAKKKIMTGDSQQNIYSFNQTINGFKALEDEGVSMPLTLSYRVSSSLAPVIEEYCRTYLDEHMVFKGIEYDTPTKEEDATLAYIARTNGGVINRMIELEKMNHPYKLTRPVKELFSLPLVLLGIRKNPAAEIRTTQYAFIEEDLKEYNKNYELQHHYNNDALLYIEHMHSDDISIISSIGLIKRFGSQAIYNTYYNAIEHEKYRKKTRITITSAHSSKGHTFDSIVIEDDLNSALDKIVKKQNDDVEFRMQSDKDREPGWKFSHTRYEKFSRENPNMELLTKQQQEEFRLYYVAVTRARYQYENAKWLSIEDKYTSFSMMQNRGNF